MKNSARLIALFFLAIMPWIFVSCLEELAKIDKIKSNTFQPSIDFPLINSDFSMEEFLTKGNSKAKISEQNGLMVLTYDDSVTTPAGNTFFSIPDQQSPKLSITGPEISFSSPGATVTVTKSISFTFGTSQGENLDSILVKAGQMIFQINSNIPANINLSFTASSLRIQHAGFQRSFSFTGPGNQNPSVNMAGSTFDLTANGTTTNSITFSITATITDTGQPINNTHHIDCDFALKGLQFRALFGDLGTHLFQFPKDTINVDVFNNAFSGNVTLLSPAINLSMRNSFGLPLGFNIQNVSAIKSNNSVITLSGQVVSPPLNPYLINAPSNFQIGQSVVSQININATNSNLPQLISSLPRYVTTQFNVQLNPPPTANHNFVLDTSRLTIGLHLELPFHGKVSSLTLSRQYDFKGLGITEVQEGKVIVKTTNETPLDAAVQVYFVDNTGTVLDSLFTNRSILKGAAVDANGFTPGNAEVITTVDVTQAKVNRIDQAEFIVISAEVNTSNNGTVPVKFSASDKLKVTVGVNTRVQYKLN